MRQIANNVYIPVLKDLVEEGKEVSMMISGSSMNPFLIHQRDYILMKKPEEELKAGDMVFFQRRGVCDASDSSHQQGGKAVYYRRCTGRYGRTD